MSTLTFLVVNPLVPETPEELEKFARGEQNKLRRLEKRKISLMHQAPTADERFIIHDLFMAKDLKSYVPMSQTSKATLILCQSTVQSFFFALRLQTKGTQYT